MIPVDLAHAGRLEKALKTGADLARHYGARATYVGVTSAAPGKVAHNPHEFAEKLDAFARAQGEAHGHAAEAHAVTSHDPAVDLDETLLHAASEIGADLIVMASHIPGITDHIWPSNGGQVARHAKASVMVVRGA